MDANYRVKRNPVTGATTVHFKCGNCASPVVFDLPDAGKTEPCPSCGKALVVPGVPERQAAEQAAKLTAESEANLQAAAERGRQAAAAKRLAAEEARRQAEAQARAAVAAFDPPPVVDARPQVPSNHDSARQSAGPKRVADMTGLELRRVIEGALVRGVLALFGLSLVAYVLWNIASAIGRMDR